MGREDERTIGYVVIDETFLTPFDRRLRDLSTRTR